MPWQLITDVDRRGAVVDRMTICPECWPANRVQPGRGASGTIEVHHIERTLSSEDECYHCLRHPTEDEIRRLA